MTNTVHRPAPPPLAQVRANRTHSLWVGGLLTLLVTILTGIVVMGATQARLSQTEARVNGVGHENVGTPTVGYGTEEYDADFDTPVDLAALVLSTTGHDAVAQIQGEVVRDADAALWNDSWRFAAATGEGAWIPIVAGRAPTAGGEIALASNEARAGGLGVGDGLTLYRLEFDSNGGTRAVAYSFTVVGLTAANALPGYDPSVPHAFISWDEAAADDGPLTDRYTFATEDEIVSWSTSVGWTGDAPALEHATTAWEDVAEPSISLPAAASPWLWAAALLFVAMVVMAFAVGRSQASARAQRIAAVRARGARRGTIAAAVGSGLQVAAAAAVFALGCGAIGAWLTARSRGARVLATDTR